MMQQEDLISYLTGNASPAESERVREWISQDPENRKEFIRLKNLFALSGKSGRDIDAYREYRALKSRMGLPVGRMIILRRILQYAAVALISVLLTWWGLDQRSTGTEPSPLLFNEVIVPKGQISEYVFNDGTHAWLNSDTRLRFPVNPGMPNREVYLEGEAFFDVSRNEQHPFIVHTGSGDIRVLGTSFNVQNYQDMDQTVTTLVEGSLEIQNREGELVARLQPGEQLKFSRSSRSGKVSRVDTAPYQAWRDGKLIFRDMSLGEIAGSLERWYNVRLIFSDAKIRNYRFTGTILKYKPFDQVLQAIRLTTPIRYQIKVLPESSNEVTLYTRD